ncbi:MAG: F0F1 ATP synthase subunit delta [Anaerolineae bacterium]|jgi:F-type H+-transporting ATPase subunit b
MLNLNLATIAFELVNFLVFAALLYYFLFRPVRRRARQRAAERERLARQIEAEQQEVEEMRVELGARLADAEAEADQIINQAQEKAEAEREALLEKTQDEVERILAEARADAQQVRHQAMQEFHDQLLDAIIRLSGHAISEVVPPEAHDRLVEQLNDRIWELGRSEMDRVETLRLSLGDRAPTAHIVSAEELKADQQAELASTLAALADRHVDLQVRVDPDLIAGLRVRLEDVVMDNSLRSSLQDLRDEVSQALEEQTEDE